MPAHKLESLFRTVLSSAALAVASIAFAVAVAQAGHYSAGRRERHEDSLNVIENIYDTTRHPAFFLENGS